MLHLRTGSVGKAALCGTLQCHAWPISICMHKHTHTHTHTHRQTQFGGVAQKLKIHHQGECWGEPQG